MSKPMPRKISFSSPSTCSKGWRLPCAGALPGSVTSISSAARRAASAALSSSLVRRAISAVMASRTSLASAPTTGRSSAESRPICFKMAVSSPFLPRKRTRSSSTAAASAAWAISASALCRMFCNASFIPFSPLYVLRDEAEKEKAPPLRFDRDEAYLFVNSAVPPTFLPYDCTRANTLLFCNGNTRLCLPAATFSKATRE